MSKIQRCFSEILKNALVVVCITIIYGILVHFILKKKENDYLIKLKIPQHPSINGWSLTHFIFYFYLGYRYPSCLYEAMLIGVLWELTEFSVGEFLPIIVPKFTHKVDPFWSNWCYGCWEDLLFNFAGFLCGRFVKTRLIQ
ncbi:Hypothetical protein KVN_LOCUS293 [uncultured virus]|nr:Hypothetical protein KVN_LOCUS293 [uncultured virus]